MNESEGQLARIVAAVSNRSRVVIIDLMRPKDGQCKELTTAQLAKKLLLTAETTWRHLKVLQSAGLVERQADRRMRTFKLNMGAFEATSAVPSLAFLTQNFRRVK